MYRLALVFWVSIVLAISGCSTKKRLGTAGSGSGSGSGRSEQKQSQSEEENKPQGSPQGQPVAAVDEGATQGPEEVQPEMQDYSDPREKLREFKGYEFFGLRDILDTTVRDIKLLMSLMPESDIARKEILEFVLDETQKAIVNIEKIAKDNGLSFKKEEDSPRNPEIDAELAQVEGATIAAMQAVTIISANEPLLERLDDDALIALKRVMACVSEIRKVSVHPDQEAYNKRAAIDLVSELMHKAVDDLGFLIVDDGDREFVDRTGTFISTTIDCLRHLANRNRVLKPDQLETVFKKAVELRERMEEWPDWQKSVEILKNVEYSDEMLVEEDDAELLMNRVFALLVRYRTLYHLMTGRF